MSRSVFFPGDNTAACAWALAELAKEIKLIAVLFADRGPEFDLLPVFAEHGFHGVMVDTADKSKGRLLDHLPPERIPGFVGAARALGLMVGLSGSLEAPDVPRLLPSKPDFLGFRGALCDASQRTKAIDPKAVSEIRALIPEERPTGRAAQVDYRLLAARGYSPDSADLTLKTNRIFVRDFVLPVEIGAYRFEHGHTQNVRFDVTADVLHREQSEDMRHVFSYDVIMDGIRAIIASGHVQLVEALAESVATHVLQDPRVMRIVVRVEKLELGPGGVGVEIERTRKELALLARPAPPAGNDGGGFRSSTKRASHRDGRLLSSLVVKLGGSNAAAPELALWLNAIADAVCPVVIVPGGGPFADHIREAQRRWSFPTRRRTPWRSWPWNSSAICCLTGMSGSRPRAR
jgi:dihydroneopterin aldolase